MTIQTEPDRTAGRMDLRRRAPDAYRALAAVERALAAGPIEPELRELLKVRASQLNGCAYCLRSHLQAARRLGVAEEKLDVLSVWQEAEVFDRRERLALGVLERITMLDDPAGMDAAIADAGEVFDEDEVAALVFTSAVMNTWNRLHAAAHTPLP